MLNAKDKGTSYEREIRDTLKSLDPKARRSIMSGAIGSELTSEQGDIKNDVGLCIECKRTEKLKPYDFYDQAKSENKNKGIISVVAMRSNDRESLALLSWSDFLVIYAKAVSNGLVNVAGFQKATKHQHVTIEESSNMMFSKKQQTRRRV